MAEQRTLNAERAELSTEQLLRIIGENTPGRINLNLGDLDMYLAVARAAIAAARRAPPALDAEGLPPLIWGDDLEAWLEVRDEAEIVAAIRAAQRHAYDAGQQSQAARIQHLTHERDLALAAARQSAPEGAPVAWITYETLDGKQKLDMGTVVSNIEYTKAHKSWKWRPLYLAAPTSASAQPADRAPTAQQIEGAVHNLLWLYRRLPRCYGRLPFVEASVRELTKIPSVTLDECFAERGASSAQISAQPPEGVEHASHNKENSDE